MRALDRSPRHGAPRTSSLHRLLVLLVAMSLGAVLATGLSTTVSAGPPSGTTGPYIEVAPGQGRATDGFVATYWYIDPSGGPCKYATADFSWDGTVVRTVSLDTGNTDPVSCRFVFDFNAPPTTELGTHAISVTACFIDSTGGRVCDGFTTSNGTYQVEATPDLKLSTSSGLAAAPIQATYDSGGGSCLPTPVQFYWDGAALTPQVTTDTSCVAVMDFSSAPTPNGAGRHTVSAEFCIDGCISPRSRASATYTVRGPPPPPTPTPTPTPTPAPTDPSAHTDPRADREADASTNPEAHRATDRAADGTADLDAGSRDVRRADRITRRDTRADRRGPRGDEPAEGTVSDPGRARARHRRPAEPAGQRQPIRAGDRELRRRPRHRGHRPGGRGHQHPADAAHRLPVRPDRRDLQQHHGRQPRRGPRVVDASPAGALRGVRGDDPHRDVARPAGRNQPDRQHRRRAARAQPAGPYLRLPEP